MFNLVLIFEKIELKAKYTLKFTGYEAHMGQKFKIEYTGPNVTFCSGWSAITEKQTETLKKILNKQYGYGPFNKEKVMKVLEKNDRYEL